MLGLSGQSPSKVSCSGGRKRAHTCLSVSRTEDTQRLDELRTPLNFRTTPQLWNCCLDATSVKDMSIIGKREISCETKCQHMCQLTEVNVLARAKDRGLKKKHTLKKCRKT